MKNIFIHRKMFSIPQRLFWMLILLFNEYEELRMDKIICILKVFHFKRILLMTITLIICDIMKLKIIYNINYYIHSF